MARSRHSALRVSLAAAAAAAAFASAAPALAQYDCSSSNPALWPPASRPYFMLAMDTSGSMDIAVTAANSCGISPNDRNAHSRCAMRNTVLAFSGEVNFGLATFAYRQNNCGATCYGGCSYSCFPQEVTTRGACYFGCGTRIGTDNTTSAGAFIRVPMQQDNFWTLPPSNSNTAQMLSWADNNCTSSVELFADGNTPLNGMLRDMKRYFQSQWSAPDGSVTYTTPLAAQDLNGTGVNGSTGCRSVNVVLLTDGDETCDNSAGNPNPAVQAAQDLYQNGVNVGGKIYKIRTYVINFAGGSQAATDAIAAAGGTTASYFATNEVQLSQALANIVAGAIKPETCNNVDDNCNGCVDEGYQHYCNVQAQANACCVWTTQAQRTTCLTNFTSSIGTPGYPNGNLALLPCTTAAQQQNSSTWLCYDPKEICDNIDNNCQSGVDEGITKCGSPLHCPSTEVCNSEDDDCDGLVNEGNVCPAPCNPTPEVCDGCDNDCDGVADDGAPSASCGLASPPNCSGTLTCKPPQPVPQPGGCVTGGGFNTCNNAPTAETCDGVDNDCDGTPDDGLLPLPCVPPGTPPGQVYGGTSQCQQGLLPCGGTCQGYVGPSAEVCDGVDNDCDGQVDEGSFGVGQPCGINQPPCTPGVTSCVNGALVCQGGNGPQPEVCDSVDNNCNGQVDETPLADGPAAGQNGCWTVVGNCCQFPMVNPDVTWCPPPGATCNDVGTLQPPCNKGLLVCQGGAWTCQNANGPDPEVCDNIDNDCDGQVDEGPTPQEGQPCGSDVGECVAGVIDCVGGTLDCVGDVPPTPEICDGLDNDCEGQIDNGASIGGSCTPPYDTTLYPGDRSFPPCLPGLLQCDGMGGQTCVGGAGPNPEVCDGLDNDCDGTIDENGPPPDGIDGTTNPYPPPDVAIGDSCGVITGACSQGTYQCINGIFTCFGGVTPQPESCDCNDNDCDGTVDNQTPNGPPICAPGKDCVTTDGGCQCAAPCSSDENPCPPGQICVAVSSSETGMPLGNYCVIDIEVLCEDCPSKTVTDTGGTVLCAPAGTELPNCVEPPVCECKGQNGCQKPCFGVTCGPNLLCTDYGPNAGTCQPNNCYNQPCQGCDSACHLGSCVDNPCEPSPCAPDEVCKPSADFMSYVCVGSCADVTCPSGQICQDGMCVPSCDPPCPMGQVCDMTQSPPACVQNACGPMSCQSGACCDPIDGSCGDCPCEGVVCPDGQECRDGECLAEEPGTGGGGGTGGGAGTGGAGGTPTGSGATGTGGDDDGIYGLPTGGGGCACEVGAGATPANALRSAFGALAALALAALRRRRKRSGRGAAAEVAR